MNNEKPFTKRHDVRSVAIGLRELLKSKNIALRKTFRIFDTTKDGFWTRHEFDTLLDIYGWELPEDQVTELFNRYDRNGDGRISFQEFASEVEERPASAENSAH